MKYYCPRCGTEFKFDEDVFFGQWKDNCPVCELKHSSPFNVPPTPIPSYESPSQYEKRTGKPVGDDTAVWAKNKVHDEWMLLQFGVISESNRNNPDILIVIADPPTPPPDGWQGEEE